MVPLVILRSATELSPTVGVPPFISKVPPSTTAEVAELLFTAIVPDVNCNVPAVTTISSSTTTSSPSTTNVCVPDVKSIDLHVIFPAVVTVPEEVIVFIVTLELFIPAMLCEAELLNVIEAEPLAVMDHLMP